jgi:hypothetical protein
MEPTLETHFMGCLRELCNHSDVFHTEFRQYLHYEVRKACLVKERKLLHLKISKIKLNNYVVLYSQGHDYYSCLVSRAMWK